MDWKEEYKRRLKTPDEAATLINSNDRIAIQGGTGIPPAFATAIAKRAPELRNVVFGQGFALAFHDYMKPEFKDSFRIETVFTVSYTHLRAHETDSYLVC